ncbi:hypothetical protein KQI89_13520 [Clostridium sp. MSJ-4]|uniref:Uncharacterized protein n=1 Tax=Clostridium simiarum TaxID=2841506 RepID=A0ABS6F2M0_9CLOT|nr:hypothetical protein [Clostridium simiarum]MBU5592767.1 hypothetical protein [Clostridium simiarum]
MNTYIFHKSNSKLLHFLIALNFIIPILSIEGFLPWVMCIFSIYKSINALNKYSKPTIKIVNYLVLNLIIVVLYNYIASIATSYVLNLFLS